jgi:hypothetical protein
MAKPAEPRGEGELRRFGISICEAEIERLEGEEDQLGGISFAVALSIAAMPFSFLHVRSGVPTWRKKSAAHFARTDPVSSAPRIPKHAFQGYSLPAMPVKALAWWSSQPPKELEPVLQSAKHCLMKTVRAGDFQTLGKFLEPRNKIFASPTTRDGRVNSSRLNLPSESVSNERKT